MYRERHIDWVGRDIRTDMKNWEAALEVFEEITSEKAMDLQMLIDFVLKYENIGEILAELQAFEKQAA